MTADHAEMTPIAEFDIRGFCGNPHAAHKIGECRQFGLTRSKRFRIRLQSNHSPAARGREFFRMGRAQVIAMGFGMRRKWSKDRRLIRVNIRQRRDRKFIALRSTARTLPQHVRKVTALIASIVGGALARNCRSNRRDRDETANR